jgi:hypothetical protein
MIEVPGEFKHAVAAYAPPCRLQPGYAVHR